PRSGAPRRGGGRLPRRPPHTLRAHRAALPPRYHRSASRDRRRPPPRDAGALAGGLVRARARGHPATPHRRLHAVHARRVPRAGRAHGLVRLLRDAGHARVSLCLRARPRQRAPRASRRRPALRPARRQLRGLRARARLHPPRPLRRRPLAAVPRMTDSAACRAVLEAALAEPAVRAWLSGIDGTGSRAVWVLFEGGFGGATLCSLIVNDTAGILDVAGGDITKKRLEEELKSLRASQKLPWIEVEPARALRAVVEALTLHATLGTTPPAAFDRWKAPFESARGLHAGAGGPRHGPPDPPAADTPLFERAGELLALPELASWFLDPESV